MIRDISILLGVGILFIYILLQVYKFAKESFVTKNNLIKFSMWMIRLVSVTCFALLLVGLFEAIYILTRAFWPVM